MIIYHINLNKYCVNITYNYFLIRTAEHTHVYTDTFQINFYYLTLKPKRRTFQI